MPKLDIVAVTTGSARFATRERPAEQAALRLRCIGRASSTAAVTSDAPLAADPAATAELAQKVKDAAIERPSPARRAAGDGQDHLRQDLAVRRPTTMRHQVHHAARSTAPSRPSNTRPMAAPAGPPAARFGGPIGFDGHLPRGRDACATGRGRAAAPGLTTATSLVLEVQTLGNDDLVRATYVFGDKTVEVNFEMAVGFKTKVTGPDRRLRRAATPPPPPSPASAPAW